MCVTIHSSLFVGSGSSESFWASWVWCGSIEAVTIELVLLIPYRKIYWPRLTCQGWDGARTGSAEAGMQKGTQPEDLTRKGLSCFLELVAQMSPGSAVEVSKITLCVCVGFGRTKGSLCKLGQFGAWSKAPQTQWEKVSRWLWQWCLEQVPGDDCAGAQPRWLCQSCDLALRDDEK